MSFTKKEVSRKTMNRSVLRSNFLQRTTEEIHEFYVKQRNEFVSLEKD